MLTVEKKVSGKGEKEREKKSFGKGINVVRGRNDEDEADVAIEREGEQTNGGT